MQEYFEMVLDGCFAVEMIGSYASSGRAAKPLTPYHVVETKLGPNPEIPAILRISW